MCINTHSSVSILTVNQHLCLSSRRTTPHILVESTPHPKAQWRDSEQGGVVHPTADYEDSRNQNASLHCKC